VDGDLQRVGATAAEGAVDPFASEHRLGAVGLPAGPGERRLDPGGERPEPDGYRHPGDEDPAWLPCGEATELADRANRGHRNPFLVLQTERGEIHLSR
jgi:hypothetical protein